MIDTSLKQKNWFYPIVSLVVIFIMGFFADMTLDGFVQGLLVLLLGNMILAMSLNLVNGFTGQFSLGHAGFLAVGGYVSAYLSKFIPIIPGFGQFLSFGILAIAGGLAAAAAGYIVGQPSLKLRGDYLAIVTLGFGEIIRVVLLNTPAVGGALGYNNIVDATPIELGPITISRFLFGFMHTGFWTLFTFVVIWRMIASNQGRGFLSVREDEIAAESMGVNTTQAKVRAFVISSFLAGVAGSLLAHHYSHFLTPSSFTFNRSVDAVIMVVLGGMGNLSGSLVAAVFITILPESLRKLQNLIGVDIRMVIYSLALILMMILRPQGLFGRTEIFEYAREYIHKKLERRKS